MISGEQESRKGADIYCSACLAHLPLSLRLNIQMKELGKSQVFGSSLRPVGALSPSSGQWGFLFLSGGFRELTLPLHDPLELPLCKKASFLPEAPMK